ncbi:hypothetical protein BS333_14380 [Vibrio azureus]|uniref:Uncharacterized protein n=2 Tax=Vibrio azureus TaxID=512649 RepID=U3AMP6_9VIBR|nr:LruC domain-containing protein [Vibrio azureus]AUI87598.1 hypothetical protein BS333_14380 [Vibrio azureus]GAD74572.1 hypothetical protein VAZ01S_012_00520 [Vibrio azureus NBRC 104587]
MFRRLLMLSSLALPTAVQANPLTLEGDYQTTAGGVNYQVSPNPISWAAFYDLSTSSLPIGSFSMSASLPGAHELVAGSIQVPNNLTVTSSSSTGFTVSADNFNPYVTSKEVLSIGDIVISGVSGDGVTPFVTKDRSRFFLVFHNPNEPNPLYCHEIQTNQACPGYPRPSPFGGFDGHYITDIELNFFDEIDDKLYQNGLGHNSLGQTVYYGINCWDMMNDTQCGDVVIGDDGNMTSRPMRVGDKIYATTTKDEIYCFSLDLATSCDGYPKQLGIPTPGPKYIRNASVAIDHRIYFAAHTHLACWDTQTDALCNSPWPYAELDAPAVYGGLFIGYDTQSQPDRICYGPHSLECISFLTGESSPHSFTNVVRYGFADEFTNSQGQKITFLPTGHDLYAYNWATESIITFTDLPSNSQYGVHIDSAGCLWLGGHNLNAALSVRLDTNIEPLPSSLLSGCKNGRASGSITPQNNYCATGSATVTTWSTVVIENITSSDYSSVQLELIDGDGNLLQTVDVLGGLTGTTFTLDINTPTFNAHDSLKYNLVAVPVVNAQTTVPTLHIDFSGPAAEVCFDSVANTASCNLDQTADLTLTSDVDGVTNNLSVSGIYSVNNTCTNLDDFDFGDAPESYGTLAADDGPKHIVTSGLHLGSALTDVDPDGIPSTNADGDDNEGSNDEDGVVIQTPFETGKASVIEVLANTGGDEAYLQCWTDWNQSGQFEADEQFLKNHALSDGSNTIVMDVPIDAQLGTTYMRCRVSALKDLGPTGFGGGGEVEDYAVNVSQGDVNYVYLPSASGWYTAAFEDNWPMMGDYDLNDVVMQYRVILHESSAHNGDVVRVDVVGQLAAYGASYNNGFALHFPGIDRAMVDAASSRFYRNQTQVGTMLDMNATELIVIASNDLKNALTFNSGCDYHRTESHCLNEPVQFTFNAKMPLASAQPSSTFIETGSMPGGYDPFIFGGGGWRETPPGGGLGREFEIHTADRAPTSVGDTVSSSFFTQGDDISDGTVYYRNSNQLPWGIIITDDWAHSLEYRDISQTYPEFPTFVTTSGAQSADWYTPSKASYGYYGSDNGVMHVTVSGGKYYLNGVEAPSLTLQRGRTYVFEQHEGTNAGHPLAIRTTDDQPYTSGVMSYGGDAGSMRSQVKFQVPMDAPDSLRYYCTVHGNGMGNVLNITN